MIFDSHAWTEPIVGEHTTPLLPSQRAGKGIITMKTFFHGSLFSACDVTAWAREVMHWISTEEK